ncbi:hypothetical protein BOTBODRAFT_33052 [Botryobasidium botryosum FD-172 SS1]|uniref:Beta-lactamase-related domain-containing protein n=1 Tax=Botryobasidium botryosum (strain FD-172 SS1) TaxID=930990 RepID=A0A067MDV2_BOTB1|nr:hypothetical protein BOTBODRAFT_33052 [Botryobasidium botryosum FD-172 SS1]
MSPSIPDINSLLKSYTDRRDGLVGLAVVAIGKNGDTIYSATSGATSVDPSKATPMTMDHVHWIASQTKLLTAIAAMQCVERGQIGLDDHVGHVLPELADPDILEGFDDNDQPKLRKATNKITLRLLLTHTSGLAYEFSGPNTKKWKGLHGLTVDSPVMSNDIKDYTYPLEYEPGTRWMNGAGVDWAGQLIGRLNNCTLGEYMQKNIFAPLGMSSTTFHPEKHPGIEARMVDMSVRKPDGMMAPTGRPVYVYPAIDELGGSGLYSTPNDYSKVLVALIQGGGPILKPESVDEICKPQVSKEVGAIHDSLMKQSALITAEEKVTFGLTVSVSVVPTPGGRSAGTVNWGTYTLPFIPRSSTPAAIEPTRVILPHPAHDRTIRRTPMPVMVDRSRNWRRGYGIPADVPRE